MILARRSIRYLVAVGIVFLLYQLFIASTPIPSEITKQAEQAELQAAKNKNDKKSVGFQDHKRSVKQSHHPAKYSSSLSKFGIKFNEKLMGKAKPLSQELLIDQDKDGLLNFDEIMKALDFDLNRWNVTDDQDIVEENMEFYREVYSKKITEPKFAKLTYNEEIDDKGLKRVLTKDEYPRANATLLTLVRNQELKDIVQTIRQIESTWNHNFHYPYTFISDESFSDEFKDTVKRHASGDVFFEIIPADIWQKPKNIDPEKEKAGIQKLEDNGVQYAGMESYHNMCRFNSGYFYRLEGLKKFKWYWRFEPKTDYYCLIDYDIFKFMEDNDKTYGFTISLYDDPLTVETLWPTTIDFIKKNPQYVNPNGAFKWLTDSIQNPAYTRKANGYSTCHFWSNFEIANMDFYRGEAYSKWMDALEEAGGFYYERWGDAPVHSVGVGLFEDKSKIHWFRDIGYHHAPYKSIPNSDKCSAPDDSGYFAPEDVYAQNCLSNWIKYEMTYKELQQY